jgi:lipopolysaccharide export system protein LptA
MRRRSPERLAAVLLAAGLVGVGPAAALEPATPAPQTASSVPATTAPPEAKPAPDANPSGGFLTLNATRSKEPITITSDNLEYQYQDGIVIYRGDVLAVQGDVKVKSNELRITLVKDDDNNGKKVTSKAATDLDNADSSKLQTVIAIGSVRIDQGTRWAVAGRATFEQSKRTLVLTENPVVHDGPNEVTGDRITVFMDENRSIVEGGPKRVKATLIPGKKDATDGAKPAKPGPTEVAAPATTAR